MAQMTPQVSKLLEQALSLSVEEQEALADSLISSLGEKVDEGVRAAWDDEIKKRITTGFGQGKNRSLVRSSQSQFGEAASCPLVLWSFTRKLPPNMTRRLIGIFSAARTQRSSSMQNLSVRLLRLRKLLSAGQTVPTMPDGSCCGSFLFS